MAHTTIDALHNHSLYYTLKLSGSQENLTAVDTQGLMIFQNVEPQI